MAGFLPDLTFHEAAPDEPTKAALIWRYPLLAQAPVETTVKTVKSQPPRLDHFDAHITPADHFRWFQKDHVSGSGRVHVGTDQNTDAERVADGEKNLLDMVALMHPGLAQSDKNAQVLDKALRKAAHKTAIIDLRTMGDSKLSGSVLTSNDKEMSAEVTAAANLGIEHKNFPLNSHDLQPPKTIKEIVDYIHGQVQKGKTVDIHCYHGTDRTGLIGQCEVLTFDPKLQHMIKSEGQKGVDLVYAQSLKSLLASGVDPGDHTEVYQSMKQYLQSLSNGSVSITFTQIPIADDAAQTGALREAAETLTQNPTMDNYLTVLRANINKFDPAVYSAFYRQLYHEFNKDYVQKH